VELPSLNISHAPIPINAIIGTRMKYIFLLASWGRKIINRVLIDQFTEIGTDINHLLMKHLAPKTRFFL
jgi:hypothetical protein